MVYTSSTPPLSYDSTEEAIKQMIGGIERMICLHKREEKGEDDAEASTTTILNPAIKKHFELQIKTLQNAPRDTKRLEKLLIEKEKEWEKS